MRKLQGLSPVLEREACMQSFGAGSFYQSKAKRLIYLNPLERLDFRKRQEISPLADPSTIPKPILAAPKCVTVRKPARTSSGAKKTQLSKKKKLRFRRSMNQGKRTDDPQGKKTSKSPPKPRRSPKIAKKGVRLYLQNLRNKKNKGHKKKAVWPGKRKQDRTASRSLEFGGKATTDTRTDDGTADSRAALKREGEDMPQSPAKRVKVTERSSSDGDVMLDSPPDSGSLVASRSPSKRASPRKRRMMTDVESLGNVAEKDRQEAGSGKTEKEFEDWLWSADTKSGEEEHTLDLANKATTPVKRLTSTPKVYPMFTPPSTPGSSVLSPSLTPVVQGPLVASRRGPLSSPKQSGLSTPSQSSGPARSRRSTPLRRKVTTRSQARSSPKNLSPTAWRKMKDRDGMEQMVLDLGQKYFGAVNCDTCGMVYTATHPEDEANHARFHRKYVSCTRFNGWKTEEVLEEFPDGRIIVIGPDAPKYAHKKVEEVRALVDRELGFVEGNSLAGKDLCKTYLFITDEKKIGGCLIAEGISKGYRVIPDQEPKSVTEESQKAWCCESEPSSAVCGVSRIWVAGLMRRKKIASRLMEALRYHFTYGSILAMDDLAFSDPTPDGKLFATTYTGTSSFLVYKYT